MEPTGLDRWKQRLFTKDDHLSVHKTLGLLSLLSYGWRFAQVGVRDMGFSTQLHLQWTIPTLLLHLSLSLSSFEFRIPVKRITTDGGRIWPQYRFHSLIFLSRSLSCIAVNWHEQIHQLDANYTLNLWIVLGTMVAGDLASHSVGKNRSNSIRDLRGPIIVKFYFSLMQFLATATTLMGWRRSSVHYYFCFVVQITAFLMTLRRKHLVTHSLNIVMYGVILGGGFALTIYECLRYSDMTSLEVISLVGMTAALWRMGPWPKWMQPLRNKYLIWTAMYFFLDALRPAIAADTMSDIEASALFTKAQVKRIAWVEVAVVIMFGMYKHVRESEIQIAGTWLSANTSKSA